MLNKTRNVKCHYCHHSTPWQGSPAPDDRLYCHYCRTFLVTYDGYIRGLLHQEVQRIMDCYAASDAAGHQTIPHTLLAVGQGNEARY